MLYQLSYLPSKALSKHARTKHGVIYIRQTPVARELQENFGIFSDERQRTGILQISGAQGSWLCIDRERVYFALRMGITLVLVVVEETPESLDSMAIGTKLSVPGGPEELVAALGCLGLCFRNCMRLVTCQAGNDSLGRRFTANVESWHVAGFSGLSAVEQGNFGMVRVHGDVFGPALILAVTARAERTAEAPLETEPRAQNPPPREVRCTV